MQYSNVTIEGFQYGLLAPYAGVNTIAGGTFDNTVNIDIEPALDVTAPYSAQRLLTITNNTFLSPTAAAMHGVAHRDIAMNTQLGGNPTLDQVIASGWFPNLFEKDRVLLDGSQLFFPFQAPDFVVTGTHIPGVDGMTNAQLWATYGIALGGAVAPTDAPSSAATTPAVSQAIPAAVNDPAGFSGATGLGLTNSAALIGSRLRLTNGAGEAASAFTTTTVGVSQFTTRFTFQLTKAQADGFTFDIQGGSPTSKIWGGAGLGSWNIARSVAVKFDLYNNGGEGNNSTGLFLNGAYPTTGGVAPTSGKVDLSGTGLDLHNGDIMSATIAYDGSTLIVKITDTQTGASATQTYAVDIPAIVGGPSAYVGFTAGTGGLGAVQDILNWTYNTFASAALPAAPTGLTVTAASSTEVDLAWTGNAANSNAVLVERSTDGSTFAQVASLSPGATSYAETGLSPATSYTFRVRAAGDAGFSPYSNVAVGVSKVAVVVQGGQIGAVQPDLPGLVLQAIYAQPSSTLSDVVFSDTAHSSTHLNAYVKLASGWNLVPVKDSLGNARTLLVSY